MLDDYKDAAVRHFNDALSLLELERFDNAGHLMGFSAECAIKSTLSGEVRVHLPELLASARKRLHSRTTNAELLGILRTKAFDTWRVDRRYHLTGKTTPAELDSWVKTTQHLLRLSGVKRK